MLRCESGIVGGETTERDSAGSIRAPLSRAGRHAGLATTAVAAFVSIRAPLSRAGRHRGAHALGDSNRVSIRAPLSRAGRRPDTGAAPRFDLFQSAPRSRERGDAPHSSQPFANQSFQSAPRSRERGDSARSSPCPGRSSFNPRPALASGATFEFPIKDEHARVSIRAPLSRAGRLRRVVSAAPLMLFQSAPRSRERGDITIGFIVGRLERFNPRPALASGATRPVAARCQSRNVSIRAPLSRAGRLTSPVLLADGRLVSIRAPLSRAGRLRYPHGRR